MGSSWLSSRIFVVDWAALLSGLSGESLMGVVPRVSYLLLAPVGELG